MMTPRHDTGSTGTRPLDAELRAAGLRVTAPRLAALAAVAERQHADVDAIAAEVRARLGTVSKQAVYDVLGALTGAGLVRRVPIDDRRARYELDLHDNHHHLVCRVCGRIEDVPCAVGAAPCLDVPAARGFAVDEADVIYRGTCVACRADHLHDALDVPDRPPVVASARPADAPSALDLPRPGAGPRP